MYKFWEKSMKNIYALSYFTFSLIIFSCINILHAQDEKIKLPRITEIVAIHKRIYDEQYPKDISPDHMSDKNGKKSCLQEIFSARQAVELSPIAESKDEELVEWVGLKFVPKALPSSRPEFCSSRLGNWVRVDGKCCDDENSDLDSLDTIPDQLVGVIVKNRLWDEEYTIEDVESKDK